MISIGFHIFKVLQELALINPPSMAQGRITVPALLTGNRGQGGGDLALGGHPF